MKYIIESNDVIGYTPKYAMLFGDGYMIQPLEDLEVLNSDYINEHFSDLQDDAYNKGYAQCQDDYGDALKHAKDTAYKKGFEDGKAQREHDDKIEVGDEVVDSSGKKGLVVSDENKCSDTIWLLINGYRVPQSVCKEDYTKTGRHFDIGKILEEMRK